MSSVQCSDVGGPEVLVLNTVNRPALTEDSVLVAVEAAGVNFADVVLRQGWGGLPLPFTPGVEGAGRIVECGSSVVGWNVGDRVSWAPVRDAAHVGSYAEFAVVDPAQLVRVPDDIDLIAAAGLILQGLTAHYLVHDQYPLGPGVTVLVHAAAGGTGGLVVQWAKHLGATVLGTVGSEEKAEIATGLGADHVVRYDQADFAKAVLELTDGRGADYIVDGVGAATFRTDLQAVADRGLICCFGQASGIPEAFSAIELVPRSLTVSGGYMTNFLRDRAELEAKADAVWAGVRNGWLVPRIDSSRSLADAADAHTALESRQTTGKLVLTVSRAASGMTFAGVRTNR